eukprot:scaffold233556_cov19-Tisochrysis_lutea.AAC.1
MKRSLPVMYSCWREIRVVQQAHTMEHYQVIRVRCELYDGEWVCADTLSAAPAFLGDPWTSRPSLRYLDLLREGAMAEKFKGAFAL